MKYVHIVITIFFILCLMLVGFRAYSNQRLASQTEIVIENTRRLLVGLESYKENYGRYPSEIEFADQNTMLDFFSEFPPKEYLGGVCSQNYFYKNSRPAVYDLRVCLPYEHGTIPAGQIVPASSIVSK